MTPGADAMRTESELESCARTDLPYSARAFERWLRGRLIEHWSGDRFWRELDRDDFGILYRGVHPDRFLVADIVAILLTGGENLTVIVWALETNRPLDDVVAILTKLDVNARRLPRYAWLPTAHPGTTRSEWTRDLPAPTRPALRLVPVP